MTVVCLEALAAIAVSLSILMDFARVVQQRSGNSGWVDTIWTFSLGLVGVGSALWPVAGAPPNNRQWLLAGLVAVWSLRLGVHIAIRTAGIEPDGDLVIKGPHEVQEQGLEALLCPVFE